MTTIMPHSQLVRRAAAFVAERLAEQRPAGAGDEYRPQEKVVMAVLDEAGMRFNLSPADTKALRDLFFNA